MAWTLEVHLGKPGPPEHEYRAASRQEFEGQLLQGRQEGLMFLKEFSDCFVFMTGCPGGTRPLPCRRLGAGVSMKGSQVVMYAGVCAHMRSMYVGITVRTSIPASTQAVFIVNLTPRLAADPCVF